MQGWYIKNKALLVTAMCNTSAQVAGVEYYHRDMRFDYRQMCQGSPELIESFVLHDRQTLSVGRPSQCTTLLQLADGHWVMTHSTKEIRQPGELLCTYRNTPVESLYLGWPAHLNMALQRLNLGNGLYLSRKDLMLLHLMLMGTPRKDIAAQFFVTVKAIEKRLTRLREMLDHHTCKTLHQCLQRYHLIPFLLAHPDWFQMTAQHWVHK